MNEDHLAAAGAGVAHVATPVAARREKAVPAARAARQPGRQHIIVLLLTSD